MMRMHNPPHPGKILHDLWIEPLNLTITETAKHLNVSRKTISEVVNGKSGISPELATRLEIAFGKSAESWLGHQSAYDLWNIQSRNIDFGVLPVKEHHA